MFTATHIDEELDINDEKVSPYGSTLRTFDATDYSSIGNTFLTIVVYIIEFLIYKNLDECSLTIREVELE